MEIGNVVARGGGRYEWRVPHFSTLPRKKTICFWSPEFDAEGATSYLSVYLNMSRGTRIGLAEVRISNRNWKSLRFTVGVKRADHSEETIGTESCGDCARPDFTFNKTRRELENGGWLLDDQLTVTIFFRKAHAPRGDTTSRPRDRRTEHSERAIVEDSRRDASQYSIEKLRSDYQKLLKSEAESDLLVVVSGREFRAHKIILRARSPVFDAMFEHETKEKQSGQVVIEDLNPDAFRDFLEYLYTGRVETFSDENVWGLYAAADKYDVQALKYEALDFMQRTLSVESICDVMALALRHQEHDLLDRARAVDFFNDNLPDIIVTSKWQAFMKENTTAANELLVKASVPKNAK